MPTTTPLHLYNSLSRKAETFRPVHKGQARVYTCGPTVYNYPHIGNMRAYVFADTLGRTLSFKGYHLIHVINITDVGHLTDDGDAGEDKLEKAAASSSQSIEDIANHYTQAYWADIDALNIRQPERWSIATKFITQMIEFAKSIEDYCYPLKEGLYFDTSKVHNYGLLAGLSKAEKRLSEALYVEQQLDEAALAPNARAAAAPIARILEAEIEGHQFGRINAVLGKKNAADFAIWRKTPPGETRQMEWDSPWGKGAPGWHLECSVMSEKLLGLPFDIHTGGIDHREIHHPNEIAQNQAFCGGDGSGANIWMHNNFLIDRTGKMSKSAGEFLRLPLLVEKGVHPLAYRLMCLQAHYRSELEFSWDNLEAALTRLKRLVLGAQKLKEHEDERDITHPLIVQARMDFDAAISDDLNTPKALTTLEQVIAMKRVCEGDRYRLIMQMDEVLGLDLLHLDRTDLRIRPAAATMTEEQVTLRLAQRQEARETRDFERSDAIRDALSAAGIDLMDGDPLGWEWRLQL